MTEEDILTTIREYPREDAPRLVYADWLDEHDLYDRARYIRLQVEAANSPVGLKQKLDAEADAILWRHYPDWLGDTPLLLELGTPRQDFTSTGSTGSRRLRPRYLQWSWQRGFVSGFCMQRAVFLEHAGSLLARWPVERFMIDCYPQPTNLAEKLGYVWRRASSVMTPNRSQLPFQVFDDLEAFRFEKVGTAIDALAVALMKYARRQKAAN